MDQHSMQIIRALPIRPYANILDFGAGTGSLGAALADLDPGTTVHALDHDTSLIPEVVRKRPNVRVIEADATTWRAPRRFDLIHARFTLIHIPERDRILAGMRNWLNPGGILMVTEPYQLDEANAPDPVVARVLGAYHDYLDRNGTALTWIRTVPAMLGTLGLLDIEIHAKAGRLGGGRHDRWLKLIEPLRGSLDITDEEFEHFRQITRSAGWHDLPQIILTVTART
ncbi:class I SAM-dependent methyltransferase [Nocardia wallacei]|nr:class I SAM-dependent methyltransferase [Nocardia wallacei]